MRLWGDFSHPLKWHDFPFDAHDFKIPVLVLSHDGGAVELLPDPAYASFLASELSVADWRITHWSANAPEIEITRGETGEGFVGRLRRARWLDGACRLLFPVAYVCIAAGTLGIPDPVTERAGPFNGIKTKLSCV